MIGNISLNTLRTVTDTATAAAQTPAAQAPATPAPAAARDTANVGTANRGAAVASISIFETRTQPATVDFTTVLPGFHNGTEIKANVDGVPGFLVHGGGRIQELGANRLRMSLHMSGVVSADLNVDLQANANGTYHLNAPENWNVSVTRSGNTTRMQNLDDRSKWITVTSTRSGEARIQTGGLGNDGKTVILRAQ